jgi:hypothetical protein
MRKHPTGRSQWLSGQIRQVWGYGGRDERRRAFRDSNIMRKLHLRSVSDLVRYAIRNNIVQP